MSERLCEMVGLKTENMPIIVRPDQRLSPICKEALEETGLCVDTIVIA